MANTTITLQSICNFAATHIDLLPISGANGLSNEPALTICNDSISSLLEEVYDYIFNRQEMAFFVTCPGKQDYQFGGACAFGLTSSTSGQSAGSGVGIGLSSNTAISVSAGTVTVTTLENHRFAVGDTIYLAGVIMSTGTAANYNSTFTDNGSSTSWSGGYVLTAVTSTTFSFAKISGQNNSDAGGSPGIADFGWITDATYVDMHDGGSPRGIYTLQAVSKIQPTSGISMPKRICVLADNGDGTLKIRFKDVPDNSYGVNVVYQAKAPLKVALTDTIAPFPDHHASVVRQAVLYRMYRYANKPDIANAEFQKLQQEIARVKAGDDRSQSSVQIVPEDGGLVSWSSWPWSL